MAALRFALRARGHQRARCTHAEATPPASGAGDAAPVRSRLLRDDSVLLSGRPTAIDTGALSRGAAERLSASNRLRHSHNRRHTRDLYRTQQSDGRRSAQPPARVDLRRHSPVRRGAVHFILLRGDPATAAAHQGDRPAPERGATRSVRGDQHSRTGAFAARGRGKQHTRRGRGLRLGLQVGARQQRLPAHLRRVRSGSGAAQSAHRGAGSDARQTRRGVPYPGSTGLRRAFGTGRDRVEGLLGRRKNLLPTRPARAVVRRKAPSRTRVHLGHHRP